MAKRVTIHNGKAGKNGAYSAKHNDRQFDISKAEHIDPERADLNLYWHRYQDTDPDMTFEECEKRFYDENLADGLKAQNDRHRKAGNNRRCKTMDQYRQSAKSCPEESIRQVGKAGDTINYKKLWNILNEQRRWELKTFPNVLNLDIALHADEQGAPHVHERKVWLAHDKDGNLIINQAKALQEMGIREPNPEKDIGRYNNPKMTYTAMCREHFIQLCREHGLEIESEPLEASKTGLSLQEYQRRQKEAKIANLEARRDNLQRDVDGLEVKRAELVQEVDKLKNLVQSRLDVGRSKQMLERYNALKEYAKNNGFWDDFKRENKELYPSRFEHDH